MLIVSDARPHTTPQTECTAYCDASGAKGSPILFMAGFASSEKKWLEFEDRWAALMDEFEIRVPFHCTEYWNGAYPDYKRFKHNDKERQRFERKVYPIIKQTTRLPFSFGCEPAELEAALKDYDVPLVHQNAFGICGLMAILSGLSWMKRHQKGRNRVEALKFMFEDGDGDKSAFQDAVLRELDQRLLFETKKNIPQFALPDILGWRHSRFERTAYTAATDRHECFWNLFHHIPRTECLMLTRGAFVNVFEQLGFPKR